MPTPTPGWATYQQTINLSPYYGQTITLALNAYGTNDVTQSYVLFDNISFGYNGTASPTATPTFTFTPTWTPTVTVTPTYTITPTISATYTITRTVTKTRTITPVAVLPSDAVAYPNPATGSKVVFMYTPPYDMATIQIRIFNLAGMRVAVLDDGQKPLMDNQTTTWNIAGVAPGIYLYQVVFTAPGGRTTESKFKKLVVSH